MSWTQPAARPTTGQAQLFEPVAAREPAPAGEPAPERELAPSAPNPAPTAQPQVVWSSAPAQSTWHSDAHRDE